MTRGVKLALLGASVFALGACAATDRQPDLDNIAANVEQTQEGDFGEFLTNLNEAGDKARRAQEIHDELADVPPYLHVSQTQLDEGIRAAEEAAEHRRRAEDALNRILDPLRARIAYLESLHVPQNTGAGIPRIQNRPPPSAPCTRPTTSVPLMVAAETSANLARSWRSRASPRGSI